MRPTLDIALSAICSTYFAQRCAIDTPNDGSALYGPGEVEHAQDILNHRAKAEFSATNGIVIEVPGKHPVWHTDDAVSSSIVPTAFCELECTESCERVSTDFPDCDNILY